MDTHPAFFLVCQVVPDLNTPIYTSNDNTTAVTRHRKTPRVSLSDQLIVLGMRSGVIAI